MGERSFALLIAIAAVGFLSACAALWVRVPERPGQTLTVLLPDDEGKDSGSAIVSNPAGATDLTATRDATVVFANQTPSPAKQMSESDVRRIFGEALSALPPPPQRYTLFFRFDSDELTDSSRSTVPEILHAIKNHPVPELLIVGHTDTTGTTSANYDLGRKRAEMVRGLLIDAGVEPLVIDVISHGESDLLVVTPDEIFEPRNRRVDISVR